MFMKKGILFALVALLAPYANAAKTITPKTPALVDDCYEISSAEELYGFADLLGTFNPSFSGCAKLTADIVVNENVLTEDDSLNVADTANFVPWIPMSKFFGVFDGQNHTVSGLYYVKMRDTTLFAARTPAGLFSELNSSKGDTTVVKNLGIVDSYFYSETDNIGAIVGTVGSGSAVSIENCFSHVRIEVKMALKYAGGMIGEVYGFVSGGVASVKNCRASGFFASSSGGASGGMVGYIYDGARARIENSTNSAYIKAVKAAGGMVGSVSGVAIIEKCDNTGSVHGMYGGGIVGESVEEGDYISGVYIRTSYNEAEISGYEAAGGIIGHLDGKVFVENAYNTGNLVGGRYSGGVLGFFKPTCGSHVEGAYSTGAVSASTWYGYGFVGTYNKSKTYDCRYPVFENVFYLDAASSEEDSFAVAMPENFFKDGTAAYQLRNYTYNYADGTVWGQDVGTDPYPVFKDAITGMSSDAMAELILHTYKGDTVAYPKYYVPGYEFSLPYVDRDNYVFQGWYENDAFTGDAVKNILADSEGDREFWAKMSRICYITYAPAGGTVDSNVATAYVEGTGLTLTRKVSRDGYVFAGWYTDSEYTGEPVAEITAAETGNKVFYAKWIKKEIPSKDADGCYVIKTAMELYGFAAIVNGTDGVEREHYACGSLANDIEVNQNVIDENGVLNEAEKHKFLEWTPIMEFAGVFDGKLHSVSGLYYNDSLSDGFPGAGFFGSVDKRGEYEDVIVKNVGIEKSYFAAQGFVGALMGKTVHYEYVAQGGIQVLNSYSTSTVHGYEATCYYCDGAGVGGLVGGDVGVTDLYIENCYNVGRVEYRGSLAGGIVGWKHHYRERNYLTMVNSYNIGPVLNLDTVRIAYDLIDGNDERTTIENSYYLEFKSDEEHGGTPLAMGAFKNGSVARLLHNGENGSIWGQNVGVDEYPNFSGTVKNYSGIEHAVIFHTFAGDTTAYFTSYMQGVVTMLPDTVERKGFAFLGWYADSALSGEPVKSITKKDTNSLEFYAKWERLNYEIATKVDVTGRGIILGLKKGGIYAYDEDVSIEAQPAENFKFAYWADDEKNTNPVLTFKAQGDTTIVAHFAFVPPSSSSSEPPKSSSSSGTSGSSSSNKEGLLTVAQAPLFMLNVVGRDILVSGVSESARDYMVFDMQGHVLRKGNVHGSNFTIPMRAAGRYLVRIGSQVQRVSVK